MNARETIEQALTNRVLFIGEQLPEAVANDTRPKYVLLGAPNDLINEVLSGPGWRLGIIEENAGLVDKITDDKDYNTIYRQAQQAMLKAGWRKEVK